MWELTVDSIESRRLTSGDDFSVGAFKISENGEWIGFTGNSLDRYADPLDRRDSEAYLYHLPTAKARRPTCTPIASSTSRARLTTIGNTTSPCSPLKYIKNAKTPTLIHVGQDDSRVPRPQSEELHMALKKLGVPTEFVVYPRTAYGITEPRY